MSEPAQLLHNMSAPPKSVVKYGGLKTMLSPTEGDNNSSSKAPFDALKGAVKFLLPERPRFRASTVILKILGEKKTDTPDEALIKLIEVRAAELPLPDGCLIIPDGDYPVIWPDLLSALAIITKSSGSVWLRSKSPALSVIEKRRSVCLLLPEDFIPKLPMGKRP